MNESDAILVAILIFMFMGMVPAVFYRNVFRFIFSLMEVGLDRRASRNS